MGEKLKWLMNALNISGVELADYLGINYAIISNWRTGKRVLKYQSKHTAKLASYILSSPAEQEGHIVRDMLKKQHPELNADNPAQLEHALRVWLTVPKTPDEMTKTVSPGASVFFNVNVETTLGIENMFKEQWRFFKAVQKLPPGQTVNVIDFGAINWTSVDLSFVEKTVEETLQTIACGHRMRIIDQITETYRPWDYMFRFIPVYLNENVTSYFYRDPQPSPLRQNLFLVEGQSALTVSSTSAYPDYVITSLYRQPEYVRFYDSLSEAIAERSHLMIQTMRDEQIHELLEIIDSHIKSSRRLYMVNKRPTFRNMTNELLREILDSNNVSIPQQKLCLAANEKSTSIRGRCKSIQIYDLDAFEAMAEQDMIVEYDLSAILGRTITITRQQFMRQLEHIKKNVQLEDYTMVIYPFSKLSMDTPPPFNIIVQDDSLSAAWDVEKYTRRMYSEDLSIVNGFYQYAESVWEHIPPVSKTAEWCRKQLDRILNLYSDSISNGR